MVQTLALRKRGSCCVYKILTWQNRLPWSCSFTYKCSYNLNNVGNPLIMQKAGLNGLYVSSSIAILVLDTVSKTGGFLKVLMRKIIVLDSSAQLYSPLALLSTLLFSRTAFRYHNKPVLVQGTQMQLVLLLMCLCPLQNAGKGFLTGKPLMKFQFIVMFKSSDQCK